MKAIDAKKTKQNEKKKYVQTITISLQHRFRYCGQNRRNFQTVFEGYEKLKQPTRLTE